LYGVHCEVFTDNQSLKYLFSQNDLNLTQTRWLEFLRDYDINFQSHPKRENVAADSLIHWPYAALNCLIELPMDLCKEFWKLELNVVTPRTESVLHALKAQANLIEEIRVVQATYPQLERIREKILLGKAPGFLIHKNGTIRFHN